MQNVQTAASLGASRELIRYNLIANNLSNTQTVGFKKDLPVFNKILFKSWDQFKQGSMEMNVKKTIFLQGAINGTGNPLDLAIDGEGFFKIKTPEGIRYTRAGNLKLDKDKRLVNAAGLPVMGKGGEITISGNNVVVEKDGTIKVDGSEADRIALVKFSDPELLKKEGHTLFCLDSPPEEIEAEGTAIVQGAQEESNVNPVDEMVKLIDSSRAYEACLRIIQSNDEIDSRSVNELGRV